LRAKPAQTSLYDLMAPWPTYIGVVIVLGLVSTAIYYTPWFVADRIRASRAR